MARDDLGAAVQALEKLSRLTPDVAEVYGNLGMVYYAQGRYRQAAGAFDRALKLNPQLPNARLMVGICYAQTGRTKEAVPILEPAFRHPQGNEIERVVGWQLQRAYVALGERTKAVEVSLEMLRRYPNDPETLYDASHLLGDLSLQTMIRLADLAPESAWTHLAFGEAYEGQMRYVLAANEYRAAARADARIPGTHFRLGEAILKAPKNEKTTQDALEAFQTEVAIDPENSGAWYEIAEIHRQQGQLEQALQCFHEAVEYHPEFEEARIGFARTLMNLNRPIDALAHLDAAVRLNPDNKVTHFLLARVYKRQGNDAGYQKEMALYQKYLERQSAAIVSKESQLPPPFSGQKVTKQMIDSDLHYGP